MNITAYMPLWARPRFTLRWMWHANRIRFPYPILFGDGGNNPVIRKIITERRDLFPNLSYKYFQYEATDAPVVQDYLVRCADMLGKIETPYVLWCDNDDFPVLSGVRLAEKELDNDDAL
jgi:glycosyltransferase domain-containing protein